MDEISRRKALALLLGSGASLYAAPSLLAASCGAPPEAQKQRWKSGESFPPLPLPVTPLRRSEKKRPPAPPVLIGKLQYGKSVNAVDANGRRYSYRDWTTDPNDAKALLKHANSLLGVHYRPQEVSFNHFSWQPQEVPVLYLTGHEGFAFSDDQRKQLRLFMDDGGFLFGDACCGMPAYRKSFLTEVNKIFPQRKCKILPTDHPIYTAYYTIDKVNYFEEGKGAFSGPPALEGVSIGCREAVVLSQYDLSCGWDGHRHEKGKRVWPAEDAIKLGINMVAYSLATYRLGLYLATTSIYKDANTGGGLVLGQIIHGGDWNPNPSGLMNLFKHCASRSTLAVKFGKKDISLKNDDPSAHPVLYMNGHDDFTFSAAEVARLRTYIARGGTLWADACCGRQGFDAAFRREIEKIVPGSKLKPLPPSHPLFRMVTDTSEITAAPALKAKRTASPLKHPEFEGIANTGGLSVIYSKYGLGCGWEDEACPYCLGYSRESARDLGMNVLSYIMTH